MADLAKQKVSLAGLTPAYVAASAGGDKFVPDADTYLHVKNGHTSPQTVTIATPRTDPSTGLAEADAVVAVTNAQERIIGPFPAETFADPADSGKAAITYSGVVALTIGCFTVPRS